MSKIKVSTIILLIAMLVVAPASHALAAPLGSGTIVNITMVTDGGITTVNVDLLDSDGLAHTVTISLETAIKYGLVIINDASIGTNATLVDLDTTLPTIGIVIDMVFDYPDAPTSMIVTMTPTVDVVIDWETARDFVPPFVLIDEATQLLIPVDPSDFTDEVTLTDIDLQEHTGMVNTITVDEPTSTTSNVTVNLIPDPTAVVEVNISLEDAVFNEFLIVNTAMIGETIDIDPGEVLTSTTYSHVVSRLGEFFGSILGVDFATLADYHDAGFGYGVISQALWMAKNLGGDAETLDAILQARLTGNFSTLSPTATNWGQFKKEVLTSGKQNLGQVMSGKATTDPEITTTSKTNNGVGKGNNKSNDTKTNNGKSGK